MMLSITIAAIVTAAALVSTTAKSSQADGESGRQSGAARLTESEGRVPSARLESAPETSVEFTETLYIGKPAIEVWHALVTPEIVEQYYMVPHLSIDLRPGGAITYAMGGEVLIAGTVSKVVPTEELIHTFRFTDRPDEPESTVIYELKDMGAMCCLTVTHKFASATESYDDVAGGWPSILSSLKTLMETGARLPWPGRQG